MVRRERIGLEVGRGRAAASPGIGRQRVEEVLGRGRLGDLFHGVEAVIPDDVRESVGKIIVIDLK